MTENKVANQWICPSSCGEAAECRAWNWVGTLC